MARDLPKQKNTTGRRLVKLLTKRSGLLAGLALLAIVANISLLAGPWLIGLTIDKLVQSQGLADPTLGIYFLSLIAIFLVAASCQWLMGIMSSRLSVGLVQGLRQQLYRQVNHLPLAFIDRSAQGDLTAVISTDIDQLNEGLVLGLPQIFAGLVSLIGSLVFMAKISWQVSLLIIAFTPFTFAISSFIARQSGSFYDQESNQRGKMNGQVSELIQNHSLVRGLSAGDQALESYREANDQLYTYGQKAQFYSSLTNPSTRLVNAISYISVAIFSSLLVVRGRLTLGAIASLLSYANQFSKPINEITSVSSQLQSALAAASRIFTLLDREPEPEEDPETPDLRVEEGQISWQDIHFSYRADQELIRNLNIEVAAKSKVAIVGPTGAGKTTLVNLLMRFYELDRGRIRIDGQDISLVTKSSLRRSFGMVLQDVWLFRSSIKDNIAFAKPEASLEEIKEACRAVGADEFIDRLPAGYDTIYGEDIKLSQGQDQLLTLARIILQNPPMLILDEATSSIDTVTELKVQAAFDQMMEGRTSFVIAHRLSTVLDADLIVVMAGGNVVEQGSFEQLMDREGLFKQLYLSQFAGEQL